MKKMGKKQTCRPGTDDANLSAHECLLDAAIDLLKFAAHRLYRATRYER